MKSFFARKKVGALLRVYASKPALVESRITMVMEAAERLRSVRYNTQPVIRNIDVLVWADERFKGESDCGETAAALKEHLRQHADPLMQTIVQVHEVKHADLYCGLLNYGVAMQSRRGIDYSMILSPDAFSYINRANVMALLLAADEGAFAAGLAINELADSVMEGRLANTFALWHNVSLMTVGGFDLAAAKRPPDDSLALSFTGWSEEKGAVVYRLEGVEEVIPLARLIEWFGQCIAPIMPQGEETQRYVVPDRLKDPQGYKRHLAKMGTKEKRQALFLERIGHMPPFLQGGIMPKYVRRQ